MLRKPCVFLAALAASPALTGGPAAASNDDAVLGPEGYRGLELGQSEQEAVDTGLLVDRQRPDDCVYY